MMAPLSLGMPTPLISLIAAARLRALPSGPTQACSQYDAAPVLRHIHLHLLPRGAVKDLHAVPRRRAGAGPLAAACARGAALVRIATALTCAKRVSAGHV